MRFGALLVGLAGLISATGGTLAHGVVGDRFFPATIASDDPFAADELALPTATLTNHEEDYDFEWSKTLFPHISVSFEGGYVNAHGPDERFSGWTNLEIAPRWQFVTDAGSEFVASVAMGFEIGGSGSRAVGDRFTTYTPTLLFGKGFGDLPDSMALLRPFALTGLVGYAIRGARDQSDILKWGGALEYSLLYLQTNVRDQGFSDFMAHLTPVVEASLESPTDGSGTTGTIDPGLIWSGQYTQFAVEAVIPINHESGDSVGAMFQLHFYVDDIFPDSLGRPLFGGER